MRCVHISVISAEEFGRCIGIVKRNGGGVSCPWITFIKNSMSISLQHSFLLVLPIFLYS